MNQNNTPFQTIRQTQRITGLSEYSLRNMVRRGEVPGFHSGKKFYVNVPELMKSLSQRGTEGHNQ